MKKEIFIISFQVRRSDESIMPENTLQAIVTCFTKATNYEVATHRILEKFSRDGIIFEKILEPIHTLKSSWGDIVMDNWPSLKEHLIGDEEFSKSMDEEDTVYGPFATYKI